MHFCTNFNAAKQNDKMKLRKKIETKELQSLLFAKMARLKGKKCVKEY